MDVKNRHVIPFGISHSGPSRIMRLGHSCKETGLLPARVWKSGLTRFLALFFHQQLVRDQRDELAVRGLVVLAVDVVAEESVEVFDALNALAFKALVAFFINV